MSILLVNDDGIHAKGIEIARSALASMGEQVIVFAPDKERSACSHSVTLSDPLEVTQLGRDSFMSSGTPVDCVKLALTTILDDPKPSLIVSGINAGSNAGIASRYSGTVAGAAEACMMGYKSIAISVSSHKPTHFITAAEILVKIATKVLKNGLPDGTFLNINVPDLPYEELRGIKFVPQTATFFDDHYVKYIAPNNREYFWINGDIHVTDERDEHDVGCLSDGYVVITPLKLDMTSYELLDEIKGWQL